MRLALKSHLVSGQKVVFSVQLGSNQEPKRLDEDTLSTPPPDFETFEKFAQGPCLQAHIQGLRLLFVTVSWDVPTR